MSLRKRILSMSEERFVYDWMCEEGKERHTAYLKTPVIRSWRQFMCDSLTDDELEAEYARWRIEHE